MKPQRLVRKERTNRYGYARVNITRRNRTVPRAMYGGGRSGRPPAFTECRQVSLYPWKPLVVHPASASEGVSVVLVLLVVLVGGMIGTILWRR